MDYIVLPEQSNRSYFWLTWRDKPAENLTVTLPKENPRLRWSCSCSVTIRGSCRRWLRSFRQEGMKLQILLAADYLSNSIRFARMRSYWLSLYLQGLSAERSEGKLISTNLNGLGKPHKVYACSYLGPLALGLLRISVTWTGATKILNKPMCG